MPGGANPLLGCKDRRYYHITVSSSIESLVTEYSQQILRCIGDNDNASKEQTMRDLGKTCANLKKRLSASDAPIVFPLHPRDLAYDDTTDIAHHRRKIEIQCADTLKLMQKHFVDVHNSWINYLKNAFSSVESVVCKCKSDLQAASTQFQSLTGTGRNTTPINPVYIKDLTRRMKQCEATLHNAIQRLDMLPKPRCTRSNETSAGIQCLKKMFAGASAHMPNTSIVHMKEVFENNLDVLDMSELLSFLLDALELLERV